VNDGISKLLCSLKYITIDDTIKEIFRLDPGTLLTKINVKVRSVFSQCIQLIGIR